VDGSPSSIASIRPKFSADQGGSRAQPRTGLQTNIFSLILGKMTNSSDSVPVGAAPAPAAIATHYDELDDAYRQIWSEHAHHGLWRTGKEPIEEAVRALAEESADAAGVTQGSRVIDLGSGYGATGRLLAKTRDARTTSLTISQRQYDYAVTADADDPRLQQHLRDWFDNGLEANAYDAVIAIESVGHMPWQAALEEAFRVLRPGGRIAVCDLVAADHVPHWQQKPLLRKMEAESHLVPLVPIAQIRAIFTVAGFVVDNAEDLTRNVRNTWPKGFVRLVRTLIVNRDLRKSLFGGKYENDGFVLSLLRMTLAERVGAVRYYLISAHKPV
jgi:tocopherol O-methyltransferase